MSEIWIVQGSTGEYSDHREWPVKAFRSRVKAERLVVEASARAREIYAAQKDDVDYERWNEPTPKRFVNEFDPGMKTDYTGTLYTCYSVELDDEREATHAD